MEQIERFSYCDYIKIKKEMVYYRPWTKEIPGGKFFPASTVYVNFPVYPHTIKILSIPEKIGELIAKKELELYFITVDGDFIELHEGEEHLTSGHIIRVRNIKRVVLLNKEQSTFVKAEIEELKKKHLPLTKRRKLINDTWRDVLKNKNACDNIPDFSEYKEFGFWYGDLSDEEMRNKVKDLEEQLKETYTGIAEKIDKLVPTVLGFLYEFIREVGDAGEITKAIEQSTEASCIKISEKLKDILDNLPKQIGIATVEYHESSLEGREEQVCKAFYDLARERMLKSVPGKAELIESGVQVILNATCNKFLSWTGLCK